MKRLFASLIVLAGLVQPAAAHDRALGDLLTTAGTYCPEGTLPADGRILKVHDHETLFSVIAGRFGGDGHTTFALPNLSEGLKSMTVANGPPLKWCIVTDGNYPEPP